MRQKSQLRQKGVQIHMQHISMNNCGFGLFLRVNISSFKCDLRRIIALNEGKSNIHSQSLPKK